MPVTPASMKSAPNTTAPEKHRKCCDIRAVIPANFEAIEQLFADFRRRCTCIWLQPDCFVAELLLREALTNAVVHGCHQDATKSVRCAVRMKGGRLTIVVGDDGEGFDWRRVRSRQADASSCSGRGMEIFRKYATRFRFSHKGNGVALVKDL